MSDLDLPSRSLQDAFIAANLNATFLLLFLSGGSFALALAAICAYVPHHVRHKGIIMGSLVIFCITIAGEVIIQWYAMALVFSTMGATKLDIYLLGISGAQVPNLGIVSILLTCMMQITADGLITWRCFHACGGSLLRTSPVLFLFIAEIALTVAVSIINGIVTLDPDHLTEKGLNQFNITQGSYYAVTAATNSLATFMIGHRIHSSTRSYNRSRKRYQHIIDIAVQSSAIYSLTMLTTAVINIAAGAVPSTTEVNILDLISNYFSPITIFVTVSAPTVMVARLAYAKEKDQIEHRSDTSISDRYAEGLDDAVREEGDPPQDDPRILTETHTV